MPQAEQVEEFRHAMATFASGVTVVSCRHDETDHAMTASAVSSVSLDPPLLLVCVARSARFHEAIANCQRWGVTILTAEALPHAAWLATSGRPLAGQLAEVPHHRSPHGYALLDDAMAWLHCSTERIVPAGDHDLMIGRVTHAACGPGETALIHWRSAYHSLPATR